MRLERDNGREEACEELRPRKLTATSPEERWDRQADTKIDDLTQPILQELAKHFPNLLRQGSDIEKGQPKPSKTGGAPALFRKEPKMTLGLPAVSPCSYWCRRSPLPSPSRA